MAVCTFSLSSSSSCFIKLVAYITFTPSTNHFLLLSTMEVVIPRSPSDFNFDSTCSSPYLPSTPKRFGDHYFSAPSSPTHASAFYADFNSFDLSSNSSLIPYDWEEKPGTPKFKSKETQPQKQEAEENEDVDVDVDEEKVDFEFGLSGKFDNEVSLSADELFDGGKIKPLKPPPRSELGFYKSPISSPRSPIAQGKKMIKEAFSPKRKKEVNPFQVAIEQSRREGRIELPQQRGRERVVVYGSSNASRKGSRSLSPYRSAGYQPEPNSKPTSSNLYSKTSTSSTSSKKWSFRDLLLFRSASEGRASDRDPLRKFSLLHHSKRNDDSKNSSFRSTDSSGSGSMRRGRVSAHELHYKSNRAVAEEMKRKTVLPYKQGLFGWFRI